MKSTLNNMIREQLSQFIKTHELDYPSWYLNLSNTKHLQELKESIERDLKAERKKIIRPRFYQIGINSKNQEFH